MSINTLFPTKKIFFQHTYIYTYTPSNIFCQPNTKSKMNCELTDAIKDPIVSMMQLVLGPADPNELAQAVTSFKDLIESDDKGSMFAKTEDIPVALATLIVKACNNGDIPSHWKGFSQH
jgi:hypothetical protein